MSGHAGKAFVNFGSYEEALAATEQLNGTEQLSNKVEVSFTN